MATSPLTRDEIVGLLQTAAIYDNRTISEAPIEGWLTASHLGRWTAQYARRAIIQHYTESTNWLMPAHITEIIRDARKRAGDTFVVPDTPDDVHGPDLPRWHRTQLAAHQDRLLAKWCAGEPLPVTPAGAAEITGSNRAELTTGLNMSTCPPELRKQIDREIRHIGHPRPEPKPPTQLRRFVGDPDQRAAARAELDAKRAELSEEAS
jgi:hypothetical protein